MIASLGSWIIISFPCPVIFVFFGNSENKQQRLEACIIIHKCAKYAKYVKKYAIKYAKKYAIKYVKYATSFTDMQNMLKNKYAKYVACAKYVK